MGKEFWLAAKTTNYKQCHIQAACAMKDASADDDNNFSQ